MDGLTHSLTHRQPQNEVFFNFYEFLWTSFNLQQFLSTQWSNRYEEILNLTQHQLPQVVMTYHDFSHPVETTTLKSSYLRQIMMDLYKIFNIGTQTSNRYGVTLNITQPHIPWVVLTYHYHSHPMKTNTYKSLYLCRILMDVYEILTVVKLIWIGPKIDPTTPTPLVMTYNDHSQLI